jgi:hypothetical protein
VVGHDVGSIARVASAALAASFKSASRKCLPGNHEPALPPCRKPPLSRAEGIRLDGKSPHRRWLGISPYSLVPSPCSLSSAPPAKNRAIIPAIRSQLTVSRAISFRPIGVRA